jgi:hypothetical protein
VSSTFTPGHAESQVLFTSFQPFFRHQLLLMCSVAPLCWSVIKLRIIRSRCAKESEP